MTRKLSVVLFGLLILVGMTLGMSSPAAADTQEESFSEPGPIDLSGTADPDKPNAGEHVSLGTLDLGPGDWTFTVSVRLFVPDMEGVFKNSQGCGVYIGGEQVLGAGGSSGIWTAIADGKEVLLGSDDHPFLQPPDWTNEPLVLQVDENATLELICFIDQSHGGATFEQREGMAATDVILKAVNRVQASPSPSESASPTATPTASTPSPAASSSQSPVSKTASLPVTGAAVWAIGAIGAVLVGVGGTAMLLGRRRNQTI